MRIYLDHENWIRCSAFFSDSARVCRLDMTFDPVPIQVDVLVCDFIWPIPQDGYTVVVEEPDFSMFRTSMNSAGVLLPEAHELPGIDSVRDKEISLFPGSIVSHHCPICSVYGLVVGRSSDLQHYGLVYSKKEGRRFTWLEGNDGNAPTAWVDGESLVLLQCTNCQERFLVGAATGGLLVSGVITEGEN